MGQQGFGQIDFHHLWRNFTDTVTNHYTDFSGRVGRPQFWYFILVEAVLLLGLSLLQGMFFTHLLTAAACLALILPTAGLGARRLQDTGRDGRLVWAAIIPAGIMQLVAFLSALGGVFGAVGFLAFYFTIGWLISLIALVAGIVLLYFWTLPGTAGDNPFGRPPPLWEPVPADQTPVA